MTPTPNRFFHLSLLFLVGLNLLPHLSDHTWPSLIVGGICLTWRLLYEYQKVSLPGTITKAMLIGLMFLLVYKSYGQILGLEAGSALLICAVSLKLIDHVGYRDAMILLFLNFMLLLARFFESQTLGMTIFASFDLIITTALLVQLHNGEQIKFDFWSLIKTGSRLLLQIAPLMILLFFVFPRFSPRVAGGPGGRSQLNGFADSMKPGSFAKFAQTEQMAFRVKFQDKEPSKLDMYWKGGILSKNQQMMWSRGDETQKPILKSEALPADAIEQDFLLEPFFDNWLFAKDSPVLVRFKSRAMQKALRVSSGSLFRLASPVKKKLVYKAYSSQESQLSHSFKREDFLQSPNVSDERVLDLVQDIKQETSSATEIARNLMNFYGRQFRYTLEPGEMKTTELGEFLFDKKIGFCEHFAVSFASLMRLAGVPSRVIVGFQGGKKNNLSGYYLVTSKDAHAWTEIWSDQEQKWLRFDPTTMVAPLRFEIGGALYHSLSEQELLQAQAGQEFLSNGEGWFGQMRLAYDAAATRWNLFLLNYDQSEQQALIQRLGFEKIDQAQLTLISLLVLLVFFLWVRRRGKPSIEDTSASHKAYLQLRQRLSKIKYEKESFEGPNDFLERVKKDFPQSQNEIENFRQAYLYDYFGPGDQKQNFKKLQKQILLKR